MKKRVGLLGLSLIDPEGCFTTNNDRAGSDHDDVDQ